MRDETLTLTSAFLEHFRLPPTKRRNSFPCNRFATVLSSQELARTKQQKDEMNSYRELNADMTLKIQVIPAFHAMRFKWMFIPCHLMPLAHERLFKWKPSYFISLFAPAYTTAVQCWVTAQTLEGTFRSEVFWIRNFLQPTLPMYMAENDIFWKRSNNNSNQLSLPVFGGMKQNARANCRHDITATKFDRCCSEESFYLFSRRTIL